MPAQQANPIQYTLPLGDESLAVNQWLGRPIKLIATGNFYCVSCGNAISKRYGQGFCYPCMMESPLNSECIVRPELCRAHLGQGRDPEWEEKHHNQPHVVYLANSGGLKVGVTRDTQVPTRWIDQGASQAIIIAATPNRYLAGQIEVALKNFYNDKTNWRKMLMGEFPMLDMVTESEKARGLLPQDLKAYAKEGELVELTFPVLRKPSHLNSVNLEKAFEIEGTLTGIRGQYLLWEDGKVLNVRRYAGVEIEWMEGVAQPVQGTLF